MKILHVETGRHLYGGAQQVLYLLAGLEREGVNNLLACPRGSAIAEAARSLKRTTLWPLPMGGELDLTLLPRLRRLIHCQRPDLIHLHSRRGADLWGALAGRQAGLPVLLSRRVDNPEPRWWVGIKYRLYDHVITISEAIRQVLIREGVAAERISCVPSAVDSERYSSPCDHTWFREHFAIPADHAVIAMVAQFIPRKGHALLLDALPQILERHPRITLLLFGRGALREEIEQRVEMMGLRERVQLPGFRDDLDRILPCLDLVVHPAAMEGLGVALLQAAAAGRPIIACRAGGIPEIVEEGVNGLLVPPGEPHALAAAVNRLLDDPQWAARLGETGRARVDTRFSIAAMVSGNLRLYRKLLRR